MGQRHQIYIIARVQGRHRCIAAFHSQWLFGRMVVDAADRVARALINPINAMVVANELAILEGLDIDSIVIEGPGDDENPGVLCPYLTGLVLTSCRVDMIIGRLYDTSIWLPYFSPSQADNDEGYTCFDVTRRGKPWHCFWWPGTGPLTAVQYLRRSSSKFRRCDPDVIGMLGHSPLLELSTLAAVWPGDFGRRGQQAKPRPAPRSDVTCLPYSPVTRSAASAYDYLIALQLRGQVFPFPVDRLLMGLCMVIGNDETRRDSEALGVGFEDGPVVSPSAVSASSAIDGILSSPRKLGLKSIQSTLQSMVIGPGHLHVLRTKLLAVKKLKGNGVILLNQLLAAEEALSVDLKPWLSTGALDASMLLDLSDALQQAIILDLSLSPTLTAEIVQALVPRLPNLRHLLAFGCMSLASLSIALPLSTYFASLPLHDSVDQNRLQEPGRFSPPECLRWVEESDPPAGLTIVMFSPSLSNLLQTPETRRYGVELAHFGAEGVLLGFLFWLQRLYDPKYRPGMGHCYFEMRAYFHAAGAIEVESCISAPFDPGFLGLTLGCLPSLIKDVSPDDGQVYPKMETPAATEGVTRVPRHPGWVLVIDTKGTMPYHQMLQTMSIDDVDRRDIERYKKEEAYPEEPPFPTGRDTHSSKHTTPSGDDSSPPLPGSPQPPPVTIGPQVATTSVDGGSSAPNDTSHRQDHAAPPPSPPHDNVPRPEYAFEWWGMCKGQEAKGLQPLERLSVRDWVARLPAGHGKVDRDLTFCEEVLARLHVVLRGCNPERLAAD